jgi:putative DNA primase/helicase
VCSRLDIEALTRDQDGGGWGYLLAFADPLGHIKQWAMPSRMLAGDGTEARATLMNMGLRIATAARARNLLTQYIQTRKPGAFATCTDRVGWHGRSFVLPKATIGGDSERVVFQSDSAMENTFRAKGSPELWRERVDPKTAGECAYMLANEQSKARATRTGAPRARLAWRLLFLSAGELGLADHMAEGMKRTRTGQEVRMADIPADAGAGLGAFESLHGHDGGAAFARHVTGQAGAVYGAAGVAWLKWLTENADALKARIREASTQLAAQLVPEGASGQVERVGARFALVGAAGELATAAGLTGWPTGESERSARACFNAWMAARGGAGNGEVVAMLRQVRRFLETHGEGRFAMWHRSADDHAPKTLQRAGVRRMLNADGSPIKSNPEHQREFGERMPASLGEGVSFEYFVLAETFKAEVCQGFERDAVCRVLLDAGCLVPDKDRTFDCKPRLPGLGLSRCYRISPAIFELDV